MIFLTCIKCQCIKVLIVNDTKKTTCNCTKGIKSAARFSALTNNISQNTALGINLDGQYARLIHVSDREFVLCIREDQPDTTCTMRFIGLEKGVNETAFGRVSWK